MSLLNKPEIPSILDLKGKGESAITRGGKLTGGFRDLRVRFKARNFLYSLSFAFEGLVYAFKTQRNFRIHVSLASLALVLATVLQVSVIEWAILWGVIGIVLFAELVNTALELFVDMLTQGRYDIRAKAIKDMAAGAVFVTAISALACGVCIFVPHLVKLLHNYSA